MNFDMGPIQKRMGTKYLECRPSKYSTYSLNPAPIEFQTREKRQEDEEDEDELTSEYVKQSVGVERLTMEETLWIQ